MDATQIRSKFLDFFKQSPRNHAVIPPAPLVLANDPTTLFTSSGMQPLIPYLLGETHPKGSRLVDSQPSFRSQDIDEVGDNRHTTFFEMLGNWSLGGYFKQEQLPWFWEFLTKVLNLPDNRLYVSVFEGNKEVEKDETSAQIWQKLGIPKSRIFYYGVDKNWWSRSGPPNNMPKGEIGGPDSEVFFEFTQIKHNPKFGKTCHPNCDCGRFLEIGNSVFIQYQKQSDGSLKELSQKNVDFGGGLERLTAAVNDDPDVFKTDLFLDAINNLEAITKAKTDYKSNPKPYRIIVDHLRASIFMAAEGVLPSNKQQGYMLRRLIRRSMLYSRELGIEGDEWLSNCLPSIIKPYSSSYPAVGKKVAEISEVLTGEVDRFRKTINKGLREFDKYVTIGQVGKPETRKKILDPKSIFNLYQTYGFPYELTKEEAEKRHIKIPSRKEFDQELAHHQNLSRSSSKGMFKGGLADHSETVTKLHTATHLLHQSLRQVLGKHVQQTGSNITAERLRFDFKHPEKLTPKELKQVESLINQKIKENLPVHKTIEDKDMALKSGALAFFKEKYPDKVSVYTIGDPEGKWFSREFCGGPHVSSTGKIGPVKINKEESIGGGVRRIYAVLKK